MEHDRREDRLANGSACSWRSAPLVSAAGLFSALLLSVTRVPFVMGEDGYLPKVLFKVHRKYGTPWVALVVSSAIYSVFILGPFQSLVVVDVTMYAAALLLEFVALVVLRIKEPDMERPYKIPAAGRSSRWSCSSRS